MAAVACPSTRWTTFRIRAGGKPHRRCRMAKVSELFQDNRLIPKHQLHTTRRGPWPDAAALLHANLVSGQVWQSNDTQCIWTPNVTVTLNPDGTAPGPPKGTPSAPGA